VAAHHNADDHSDNLRLVANSPRPSTTNSDEAFWGNLVFAANYNAVRIIDVSNPTKPQLLTDFVCPSSQNDVSVWENLLFISVGGGRDKATCDSASSSAATAWRGLRIVDVADPTHPKFIKGVFADCGSHTHTLVPDIAHGRVLIYVSSYLLGVPDDHCRVHGTISVIEVPLSHPSDAKIISTPSTLPAEGCHDVTVFLPLKRASAACINEGQIWDISDPVNPKTLSHIYNPALSIWHSSAWTWDGKMVAFGDEFAGATATPECAVGSGPLGAIWFYNVADPTAPAGHWSIPQAQSPSAECTAHNFNVLPVDKRYVLNTAYYSGGTSIVEFTDPANPKQLAYYNVKTGTAANTWSSYFYNGYIYANDISRGLDILRWDDPLSDRVRRLGHLNAQTQEVFAASPPTPVAAPASPPVPPSTGGPATPLPQTNAAAVSLPAALLIAALLAVAAMRRRRARRG
jgi:hypothetical protein